MQLKRNIKCLPFWVSSTNQSRALAQPQRWAQKWCPRSSRPRPLCDRLVMGDTQGRLRVLGLRWGSRPQTQKAGRGEDWDHATPWFLLPKIRCTTHKTAGGATWQKRPEGHLDLVSISVWKLLECPAHQTEGQERWGHISRGLEQHRCHLEYIIWGRPMTDAPKPWKKTVPCSDLFIKDCSKNNVLFTTHWYLKEQQPLFPFIFF